MPEPRPAHDRERFLVTGALGCIGSWVLKQLVGARVPVVAYDRHGASMHRARLVMTPEELGNVEYVSGDVRDKDDLQKAVLAHRVTHVVHLAALQVPFVKADPMQGALVNVVGTTAVFEVARDLGSQIAGLVYASSAACGVTRRVPNRSALGRCDPRPTTLAVFSSSPTRVRPPSIGRITGLQVSDCVPTSSGDRVAIKESRRRRAKHSWQPRSAGRTT